MVVVELLYCAYLIGKSTFLVVETSGQTIGNIVPATKMFLNLFGNIFAFREAKFCFGNNVSRGGQTGKHHREHNVSSTMFPL